MNLLVLINKTNLILYEIKDSIPTAKLTVPLGSNYDALKQFLKEYKNPVAKVVLDQTGNPITSISIPDIGKVNIEKKLKSFIRKDTPDISTSLLSRKADHIEKNWEFLITKNSLNKSTKTALSALLESEAEIHGLYLSFSSNVTLCQKLSKLVAKEKKLNKNHPLTIYLQDSNECLYEFAIQNHKVVNVKTKNLFNQDLPKYLNKRLKIHNERKRQEGTRAAVLMLLPEQLRTKIRTSRNQFFMSPMELYNKNKKATISTQATYTAVLCNLNFIRYNPEPLPIKQIKKHKALYLVDRGMDWLFAGLTTTLLYMTVTMMLEYKDFQRELPLQQRSFTLLQKDYEYSLNEKRLKEQSIKTNKNALALYQLIRSNNYSTRTLDSIAKSNTNDLNIRRFTYFSPLKSITANKIELELDTKEIGFVRAFTNNLKKNLPAQDIMSFVKNIQNPGIIVRVLYPN